jgi:hypothetical protein
MELRINRKNFPKEYRAWGNMKNRCYNKSFVLYDNYGGRGIKVSDDWINFQVFFVDVGKAPSIKHSLDRIDVNGDYCKENCKWSTSKEQNNNKTDNHLVTYKGKTQTLQQWADEYGIWKTTLLNRLKSKNFTLDEAMLLSPSPSHKKHSNNLEHYITYNNETKRLCEWAKIFKLNRSTLRSRYIDKKEPVEEYLFRPAKSHS